MENIKMHKIQLHELKYMNYENIMAKSNYKTLCDHKKKEFRENALIKRDETSPQSDPHFPKARICLVEYRQWIIKSK
jgi:hypothetical protein